MEERWRDLVLLVVGFVGAFFVLGEMGFYRTIGLTPGEALDWVIGPFIGAPAIVGALGALVLAAYLAGRIWDGR